MPFASPLNFSRVADYVYDFCPLSDQYVGPNVVVCDVEHGSFQIGLRRSMFVLCLFCELPDLCSTRHSWQHAGVIHRSFQTDGNLEFEEFPVFETCLFACRESELYLNVLVLFLDAVELPLVFWQSANYSL